MRAFRAEGLDWALLNVDAENPSGARALYERLGFGTHKTYVALDKEVNGPAETEGE
jgi:ribosomal protein S18 acetylase RimI-like enzyme